MSLINRGKVLKTIPSEDMVARMAVMSAQVVDAIPIEWINQRIKGLKIQLMNADEDDVDLIWHLRDEIRTLTELIDYWKAEQGKQHETIV